MQINISLFFYLIISNLSFTQWSNDSILNNPICTSPTNQSFPQITNGQRRETIIGNTLLVIQILIFTYRDVTQMESINGRGTVSQSVLRQISKFDLKS